MQKFDPVGMSCLIGGPASQRNTINCVVEKRCEGCREHVYLRRPLVADAHKKAAAINQRLVVVCWKCATPWLERVAAGKAGAVGTPDMIVSEVMPRVAEIRREQTLRN